MTQIEENLPAPVCLTNQQIVLSTSCKEATGEIPVCLVANVLPWQWYPAQALKIQFW